MIKQILSYLLHHANRETRSDIFYSIKDRILTRYGKVVGYDVQYIEGKKCHSCHGSGIHKKYDRYGFVYDADDCWHCHRGWYKQPMWVLLQRLQFGKYIFHKPIQKQVGTKQKDWQVYDFLPVSTEVINGYIEHTRTKFGKDALVILYLLYDWKGFWKRWYKTIGRGWYLRWWSPRRWPNNIAHLIRYRGNAIPFYRRRNVYVPPHERYPETEDLPF